MKFAAFRSSVLDILQGLLPMHGASTIIFSILRLYELFLTGTKHVLPENSLLLALQGIGSDIIFFFSLFGVIALLVLPFTFAGKKVPFFIYSCIASAALILYLILIQYFSITFIPLGSDLYGYSWTDVTLTIASSGGIDLIPVAAVLLIVTCFIFILRFVNKFRLSVRDTGLSILISVVMIPLSILLTPRERNFASERNYFFARNKLSFFIDKSYQYFTAVSPERQSISTAEFPLVHDDNYPNVLGPFFRNEDVKPNLVFLIIEGLGSAFVGDNAEYRGFTPFLDSLSRQSLYWENILSTTGRTFGVLPGMFGSLPFGDNGFMEMDTRMPGHLSLISILNENGYFSSYYYGGAINFDRQNIFLERQNISCILDEQKFGGGYTKSDANDQGFSWGYADGDLFRMAFDLIDERKQSPRIDIYMTLSTHEPFIPPHHDYYEKQFEERVHQLPVDEKRKNQLRVYRSEFSSLLYTDAMLKEFFRLYTQRPEYSHTIFFITGDHRIIPVPLGETIDRYHVPLIIYSPLLRHTDRFLSVSTHFDVTPSVIAFLRHNYHIQVPNKVHWLGDGIDTAREFRNIHSIALMRNKNELIDYLHMNYYLAGEQTFLLRPGLHIEPITNDSLRNSLRQKLLSFKATNQYVCRQDKIYPVKKKTIEEFISVKNDSLFAALHLDSLNAEALYSLARTWAIKKRYDDARIICRHLLGINPSYHDVRVLLGRTYAWQQFYWSAEPIFREVLQKTPHYPDAVVALADNELWQGHNEVALSLIMIEEPYIPGNIELLLRKSKVLFNLGKKDEAGNILKKIRTMDPYYEEANEFRKKFF